MKSLKNILCAGRYRDRPRVIDVAGDPGPGMVKIEQGRLYWRSRRISEKRDDNDQFQDEKSNGNDQLFG